MVWFFTRDAEKLKAETRFDDETREYVLMRSKGRLEAERCQQEGPPLQLREEWRDSDDEDETVH